ncbi:hypothetical protein [Novosphingobium sp. ST904]|uniref:hypothetical protein n=1 Tax=Novosphingobium sp. ST904 TaxID=1684385 RepID=UPI0006C8B294|nr:hypothetical protein [Novosphingobium sp. ST904]
MMRAPIRPRLLLACALLSSAALSGCTSLGGNVSGSFACRAPDGICAPSATIDDRALALISGSEGDRLIEPAGPYVEPPREGRGFQNAAATVRTRERVLRIVFPAQIDAAGRLHEQSAVHAVVEQGEWREELASSAVATTPREVAAATAGIRCWRRSSAPSRRQSTMPASIPTCPARPLWLLRATARPPSPRRAERRCRSRRRHQGSGLAQTDGAAPRAGEACHRNQGLRHLHVAGAKRRRRILTHPFRATRRFRRAGQTGGGLGSACGFGRDRGARARYRSGQGGDRIGRGQSGGPGRAPPRRA